MILALARPAAGYPLGLAEREDLRRHYRCVLIGEAVRDSARIGRTRVCQGRGRDHLACAGAAVCLCDCHDPREGS